MISPASEQPAADKAASPYVAARPLRRFLGRHNRQALLLACISLVAALLLWGVVYGFSYWFVLVAYTLKKGLSMEPVPQFADIREVNLRFPWCFALGAVVYLGIAATLRRLYRPEKIREAGMYFFWVMLELFMVVPNVTFSVWGNLRAMTRLGKIEIVEAWYLLHRMNAQQGKLSLNSLPLEIEDEKTMWRVVFALQIMGLVGMRENSQGWFLYLQGKEAHALLRQAA